MNMEIMKYAERLIACILSIMVLTGICSVYAEDIYTSEELAGFDENVSLLSAFGLLDEKRDAATTIQRDDFAEIMLKYLGYGEEFYFEGTAFSDVPDRRSAIYGMMSLGLMSGYGDGTFHPDEDISIQQAVKVIVTALGYDSIANMNGGYPSGYLTTANQMELLKNTSAQPESTLTYFNLVQMLVNALEVELITTDFNGSFSRSDQTWLSTRLDCEKRNGIVTAAKGVSLTEDSSGENTVTIDGVVYDANDDYSSLIGAYTEFYVNGSDTVVYIKELRTERTEFAAEDILDYSTKTYTVEDENGRKKEYRLEQGSYIIFNGVAAEELSEEDMCPQYGTVTLIDNNSDRNYDAVIIESYEIYVVQSVNKTDKNIYCKDKSILELGSIADDSLTITNKNGTVMDFDDITVDSVIRAAFSKDMKKAEIIISTDTVAGTVTRTEPSGKYTLAYIDDVAYRLVDELADSIFAGRVGTFYLDSEGIIAAVSSGDGSYTYGYLLNAYIPEFDYLELQVIDSQGSKQELKAALKMSIDGLTQRTSEQVLELLQKGTGSVVKQVIRYKTNGSGEIIEIDTPYNDADNMNALPQNGEGSDTLRVVYSGTTEYTRQLHNFRGQVNVDSDTLVFVVTGSGKDDYTVKSISELPSDTNIRITAYADDESEFYAKVIFSEDRVALSGGSNDDVIGVIGKISEAVNEDGEMITRILFKAKLFEAELDLEGNLINGFPYSSADEPQYKPEVGDIVSLKYSGNEAHDVALVYKPSEDLFPAGKSYGTLTDTRVHYIYGSVYSLEKGCMNITSKDIEADGIPSIVEVESFRLSDFSKIFKCTDVNGKKYIEEATSADIIDYKTAGMSCSNVFAAVEWEYPNILVIYE